MCLTERLWNTMDSNLDNLDLNLDYNDDCHNYDNSIDQDATVLSIISLNIQGLISKQHELTQLKECSSNSRQLDIYIVNETWLSSTTEKLINIPNYELVAKKLTA